MRRYSREVKMLQRAPELLAAPGIGRIVSDCGPVGPCGGPGRVHADIAHVALEGVACRRELAVAAACAGHVERQDRILQGAEDEPRGLGDPPVGVPVGELRAEAVAPVPSSSQAAQCAESLRNLRIKKRIRAPCAALPPNSPVALNRAVLYTCGQPGP